MIDISNINFNNSSNNDEQSVSGNFNSSNIELQPKTVNELNDEWFINLSTQSIPKQVCDIVRVCQDFNFKCIPNTSTIFKLLKCFDC